MVNERFQKFDLENAVGGGPVRVTEKGRVYWGNLSQCLPTRVEGKDLLIHITYLPEENRCAFTIYREKD